MAVGSVGSDSSLLVITYCSNRECRAFLTCCGLRLCLEWVCWCDLGTVLRTSEEVSNVYKLLTVLSVLRRTCALDRTLKSNYCLTVFPFSFAQLLNKFKLPSVAFRQGRPSTELADTTTLPLFGFLTRSSWEHVRTTFWVLGLFPSRGEIFSSTTVSFAFPWLFFLPGQFIE